MRAILFAAALGAAAVSRTTIRAQAQRPAISPDALAAGVVANNPERRFYQQQTETAGVQRDSAGRLADPELVAEFSERRITDPVSGVRTGHAPAYAASIVQPIEFGGRIVLRRVIAERQVELARIGLPQFGATLTARTRTLGYALFAAVGAPRRPLALGLHADG